MFCLFTSLPPIYLEVYSVSGRFHLKLFKSALPKTPCSMYCRVACHGLAFQTTSEYACQNFHSMYQQHCMHARDLLRLCLSKFHSMYQQQCMHARDLLRLSLSKFHTMFQQQCMHARDLLKLCSSKFHSMYQQQCMHARGLEPLISCT